MLETMYDANGVGLAAQQVGLALQMTVIDVSDAESRPSQMWLDGEEVDPKEHMPLILINPELQFGDELEIGTEGCLSFPEVTAEIQRAAKVTVTAQDLQGNRIKFEAAGLLGRAVQHETDHLNGILFIDRMSSAAKASLAGRLKRLAAESKK
jgi:peptide deformylase